MKSILKITFVLLAITASIKSQAQSKDTTFLVNGVCEMCERVIEKAADMDGVDKADWNVETKVLHLKYNPQEVDFAAINKAINNSGYDTQFSTAPDSAYQSLHACCFYRDPKVLEDHKSKKK